MKLLKSKKVYAYNFIIRIIFLLVTPLFFQYFAMGFIWHSIYWGVITFVVIIWGIIIISSPLIGRMGCGWFCFFGTASDLSSQHALFKIKWKKPKVGLRILMLIVFFSSAFIFYYLNTNIGRTHRFDIIPDFLELNFNKHYQFVWVIDISIALFFGLVAERRWVCKNICPMGSMCAVGAEYSRLLPVVDTNECTLCGQCEKDCLVRLPMLDYIKNNKGLITNAECILCGKCVDVCHVDAIELKFIWNRKNHLENTPDIMEAIQRRKKKN